MGFGRDDDEELRVPGTGVLAEEVEVVRVAEWGDGYGELFVRSRGKRC